MTTKSNDNIEGYRNTVTKTVYDGDIIKDVTEDTVTADLNGEQQMYDRDLFSKIFQPIIAVSIVAGLLWVIL